MTCFMMFYTKKRKADRDFDLGNLFSLGRNINKRRHEENGLVFS